MPFTCGGSRKLPQRIGVPLPARKRKEALAGWCCATRSTTKRLRVWASKSCSARGWAKPAGLGLNGSLKFEGAAIVNCCRTLGQFGVLSTLKPAGQSVYRRTCANSFRLELALILVLVVLERHRKQRSRTTKKRELNIERCALSVGRCKFHLPKHARLSLVIARRFSSPRCCTSTGK